MQSGYITPVCRFKTPISYPMIIHLYCLVNGAGNLVIGDFLISSPEMKVYGYVEVHVINITYRRASCPRRGKGATGSSLAPANVRTATLYASAHQAIITDYLTKNTTNGIVLLDAQSGTKIIQPEETTIIQRNTQKVPANAAAECARTLLPRIREGFIDRTISTIVTNAPSGTVSIRINRLGLIHTPDDRGSEIFASPDLLMESAKAGTITSMQSSSLYTKVLVAFAKFLHKVYNTKSGGHLRECL